MDCIGYKIATEPTSEPVTAAEMREYLRMDDTSLDSVIEDSISEVRAHLEQTTGRIFLTSVYDVQYKDFDAESLSPSLILPVTPVQSITSIYYELSGVLTLLAATQYKLSGYRLFPEIVPAYGVSWPTADDETVIVKVSAGGLTSSKEYKTGCAIIKAVVADIFEHPEASVEAALSENESIDRILSGYRTR